MRQVIISIILDYYSNIYHFLAHHLELTQYGKQKV
jgi:hypothetical protein